MTIKSISEKEAQILLDQAREEYQTQVDQLRAEESVLRDKVREQVRAAKLWGSELTPSQLYQKAIIESQYDPVIWDEWQQIRSDEYQKRVDEIRKLQAALRGQKVNVRQATAPWQICYGQVRTGGVITFITTDQPGGGEFLHVGFTLAGHPIDSVQKVFINKEEVSWEGDITTDSSSWGEIGSKWENLVFISLRTLGDHTEVNWDLWDQSNNTHGAIPPLFPGQWTSNHMQLGRAFIYMIIKFDNEIFANGFPDVEFEIKGNNKIYDPRTSSTGYSANAALILAHHLTNSQYGMGGTWADVINETNLEAQADICDEDVTLASGSTEKRYEIHGILNTDQTRRDQLSQLLTAIGGSITYTSGQWLINCADWPASAGTLSLDEGDTLSSLEVSLMPGRASRFNGVHGQFVDASDGYILKEFPPVKNSLYLSEDQSIENWLNILLPCTTSVSAAQRLAKIELERIRQGIEVKGTFSLKAFQAQVGDVIALTNSALGWSGKLFEVTYCQLVLGGSGDVPFFQIALTLQETAEAVFNWDAGEETQVDLAPNTNLPSPSVVYDPTGFAVASGSSYYYICPDGTVVARAYLSWTAPTDPFVKNGGLIEVGYKKSSAADWIDATPVPGASTFTYIMDVQDGELYDFRIRSSNVLGVKGNWKVVNSHKVVGKDSNPSTVQNFRASVESYGILLLWDEIVDPDRAFYRIKSGDTWATATLIGEVRGNSHRWTMQVAGTYTLKIKAVDTTGNESTSETTISVIISAPGKPTLAASISGENVTLSWSAVTGQYAIEEYQLSYGATAGANSIANIKTTSYTFKANWSGDRIFWIKAKDVVGNLSDAGSKRLSITPPGAVASLSATVMDNNVLLKWTAPSAGTLPIDYYNVYKGDTYAVAELVGSHKGTFATVLELTADKYTYWVVPIDTAANSGTQSGVSATVLQPPDFVLRSEGDLEPHYAKTEGVFKGIDTERVVAFLVSANSEYLSIADNANISIGNGQDFTIICRFRPTLDSAKQGIISKYVSAASGEYELGIDSNNKLYFCVSGGSTATTLTASNALTSQNWITAVAWYDNSEQKIHCQYTDVSDYNASHTADINDSVVALNLGRVGSGSCYFDGNLAFAALHKRVLNSIERQKLIDVGGALDSGILDAGLLLDCKAAWDFTETSGDREDAVGANDLTDNNTVSSEIDDSDYSRLFELDLGEVYAPAVLNQTWIEHFSARVAKFTAANSESLSVADNADLSVTTDFTIAGWVNFTSVASLQTVISKWLDSADRSYALFLNYTTAFEAKLLAGLVGWWKGDAGVTADGSSLVSSWVDQAGGAYDLVQSTAGYKPFATRSDNVENTIYYSEAFSSWSNNYLNVTTDATTGPISDDGNCDLLIPTTDNNSHRRYIYIPVAKGEPAKIIIYAKAAGYSWLEIIYYDGTAQPAAYFNVSTGAVGSVSFGSGAIEAVAGWSGWYKCTWSFTPAYGTTNGRIRIGVSNANGNNSFAGDGSSGIYISASIRNNAAHDSTYVKTTSFGVFAGINNRSCLYFPGSAYLAKTYTAALDVMQGNGTVVMAFKHLWGAISGYTSTFIDCGNVNNTKGWTWNHSGTTYKTGFITQQAGANTSGSASDASTQSTLQVHAFVKNGTNGEFFINNVSKGSFTCNNSVAASNNFAVGGTYGAANFAIGKLCEILIFNRALNSYELQLLQTYLEARWSTSAVTALTLAVSSDGSSTTLLPSTFGSLQASTWYFLAARYDGSNLKLRVKSLASVADDTLAYSADVSDGTADFILGAMADSFGYLNALLRCCGVWNAALTDDNLTTLFNAGAPLTYSELTAALKTNLISYWQLDESSGERADSHTNGYDLTDNNTVTSDAASGGKWATIQNQIDAGYSLYIQPTTTSTCYVERIIDFGATLASAICTISYLETSIDGSITTTVSLAASSDGETFDTYQDQNSIFATNIRALKIKLSFVGADATALSKFSSLHFRLDVKRTKDNGEEDCCSSDYYGTVTLFSQDFLDVERIGVYSAATARAAQFVAANEEYLSAADHADLTIGDLYRTFTCWVRFDVNNRSQIIFSKYNFDGVNKREYRCYLYESTSWGSFGNFLLRFAVSSDGTSAALATVTDSYLGQVPAGEWIFIACLHDKENNLIKIKVNDLPFTETAHSAGVYDGDADFRIGADDSSAANDTYLAGCVRNLAVFESCLSKEELDVLYYRGLHEYAELTTTRTVALFEEDNSEYLSIADNAALSITGAMSIALWFKPNAAEDNPILHKWGDAGHRSYNVEYASGNVAFTVSNDGTNIGGSATSSATIAADKWHFVVGRYDGASIKIWLNGTEDTAAYSSGVFDSDAALNIGYDGAAYLDGSMALAGIWSRALTNDEILILYNNKQGLAYEGLTDALKVSLIAYWDLDEASGTREDSHSTNDLTDNNTVTSESTDIAPYSASLLRFYPLTEASGTRTDSVESATLTDNNTVLARVLDVIAIKNFEDNAYPTKFYSLLFTQGKRISGAISWQAEGFVNAVV